MLLLKYHIDSYYNFRDVGADCFGICVESRDIILLLTQSHSDMQLQFVNDLIFDKRSILMRVHAASYRFLFILSKNKCFMLNK